jgi:hypothetical protein
MSDMQHAHDDAEKAKPPVDDGNRSSLFRIGAIVGGAILTAILLAFALAPSTTTSGDSQLTSVMVSDLDAAASSLSPADSAQRLADAKNCKVPLATVAVSGGAGAPDSTIRIRSGDYVSPPFKVSSTPQRIAIPYPAPYPTGKGVISVLGEGRDIAIWLAPVWNIYQLNGAASLNVWWATSQSCPGT